MQTAQLIRTVRHPIPSHFVMVRRTNAIDSMAVLAPFRGARKMCAVIPAPSWQGGPLTRPRCIPPAHDAFRHRAFSASTKRLAVSSPFSGSLHAPLKTPWSGVLPLNSARETSLSLRPSTKGRIAAPWHPRAGLGAFRSTCTEPRNAANKGSILRTSRGESCCDCGE